MGRVKLIYYDRTSLSGKAVARFTRGKNRLNPNSTTFRHKDSFTYINWGFRGNVTTVNPEEVNWLNLPKNVALASSKIRCLTLLDNEEIPTLEFTTDRSEAEEYVEAREKVYCRTLINSHSGKGIIIAEELEDIVDAPLYTVEFDNDIEFRVHVFNGVIIDIQQKRKMSSERRASLKIDKVIKGIRNLKNGYSFVREDLTLRNVNEEYIEDLYNIPLRAVEVLGLDFAAVDLLYNSENDSAVICEVNTAPGMKVGTTTHYRYIKAIQEYAGNEFNTEIYNNRYGIEFDNRHENNLTNFLNHFTNEA